MRTRLLVIDCHPVVYRNLYAKGTRDLKTSAEVPSGAFYGSLKTLLTLKNRFPSAYMLCAFDGGSSGRHGIYPEYKPVHERNLHVQDTIEHVRSFCSCIGLPVLYEETIEADDLISISASMWIKRNKLYHSMIVSSDNDFFQLVNSRITMFDDRAKLFYGPDEVFAKIGVKVENFIHYKCLYGDVADHIPGIPGFGKVKAAKYAPTGILGVPEEYKEDFQRNKKLISLPHSFKDMEYFLDRKSRSIYTLAVENIFRGWEEDEGRHLNISLARKMLDYYEIKSLSVEDFL